MIQVNFQVKTTAIAMLASGGGYEIRGSDQSNSVSGESSHRVNA